MLFICLIRPILKGCADVAGFVVGGVATGLLVEEQGGNGYQFGPNIPFNFAGGVAIAAGVSASSFND